MKTRFAALAIGVLLAALNLNAATSTYLWTNGGGDGKWSTPANWSPAGPPSSGANLTFPSATTATVTNDLPSGSSFAHLSVGCGYTIAGSPFVLTAGYDGSCTTSGPPKITADVTFSGNQSVTGGPDIQGATTISGTLSIQSSVIFEGLLKGSGSIVSPMPDGYMVEALSGGTFVGSITAGDLLIQGDLPGADVTVNRLYGRGTVGKLTNPYILLGDATYYSPTAVVGTLHTKDLQCPVPYSNNPNIPPYDILASGHDEIFVTGTVALNGNLPMAIGTVTAPLTVGQTFVLIDNDGTDPVIGTFTGKPEGTLLASGNAVFKLSYHGGDGNDVTLTVSSLARTWTGGGGSNLWSNPANWSPAGVPQTDDVLVFDAGSGALDVVDDLPGGTSFSAISGTGHVHISGNSIVVSDHISGDPSNNPMLTIDDDLTLLKPFRIIACIFNGHVHITGDWDAWSATFNGPLDGSGSVKTEYSSFLGGGTYTGNIWGELDTEFRGAFPAATVSINIATISGSGNLGKLAWGSSFSPGSQATGPIGRFDIHTDSGGGLWNCTFDVTPGSNDLISVTGPVAISSYATLAVRVASGTPAPGTTYVLVANDGTDPVQGTWSNAPEGAIINASGFQMRVSYKGGDGNDITVTVLAPAKTWTNASGDGRMSNAANWNPATVPVAGESLSFPPQSAQYVYVTNDLTPGISFETVSFGSEYIVEGNALTITKAWQGFARVAVNVKLVGATIDGSPEFLRDLEISGAVKITGNNSVGVEGALNGSGTIDGTFFDALAGGNFTGTITGYEVEVGGALPNATIIASNWFSEGRSPVVVGDVTAPEILGVGDLTASSVTINRANQPSWFTAVMVIVKSSTASTIHAKRFVIAGPLEVDIDTPPVAGTVFKILDNQGSEPIHGTFDDRPEGAQFDIAGIPFRISYKGGDGNDCTLTALAAVQTTLSQSAATTRLGEKFTLTAAVSSTYGALAGPVSFYDGSKVVGTSPVVNGIATLQTNAEPVGTYDFVATYTGSGIYANSTSNHVTHTVNRALPVLNVSRITVGQSDFVTVGVGRADGVDFAPTGNLKITGEAAYSGAVSAQIVTVPVGNAPLASGTHHVVITYAGDAYYDTVTQPFDFVVAPPTVDIVGTEVSAGDPASIALKLSRASRDPISIKWSTHDGTAVSPTDYVAASDKWTFTPGSTVMTVKIPTYDHTRDVRTFTVTIDLSDAPIHNNSATVRIVPVAPGASRMSLQYASRPTGPLTLDLYSPSSLQARGDSPRMPLVIALQAPDWSSPEDAKPVAARETERGYLVAVVHYRTSGAVMFPAQMDDIKDAVRWLRANAATYGIDTSHIGVWGFGAGGHLAALLGTTATDGDSVQAVVDWAGPTDLTLTSPCGRLASDAAALLGCGNDCTAAAAAANPATFASADDPPFLIVHGAMDCAVLPEHALRLQAALHDAGLAPLLDIEQDLGGYDDPAWNSPDLLAAVDAFLDQQLRPLTKRRASH